MGANGSKLSSEELIDLSKNTNFSRRELTKWNSGFLTDYSKGFLTAKDFENIFRNWFPFGESKKLALYIFSKFDGDNDGMVDFKDFILVLSVFGRGSFDDRLKLMFNMHDMDEDGYIGRAELEYLISIQTRALGDLAHKSQRAQFLFDKLDIDKDGRISFQEFKNGVINDEEISRAFNMYNELV